MATLGDHLQLNANDYNRHTGICRSTVLEVETCIPMPNQYSKDENGVFLTWENLWVTISDRHKGTKSILQDLNGYARPGELLALMGPSGCGKSTLLDALSGRLGMKKRHSGEILINGRKEALAYGTSAYVTQDDPLISNLTMREAIYYSAELQLPDSMTKSEKKERADMTIREMGLQNAVDTRIGGWAFKGLSDGQKKRVSICIQILSRPKLLLLDEPTTGLDSAASYYVMSRIANLDKKDRTIIAAIHQPSSEVFKLFQNLCLLSSGKVIYFGPASAATEFFALNGFPCPALQNPADHFLKIINKDFDKGCEEGLAGEISTEEAINILAMAYKSSDISREARGQIAEICNKEDCGALERRSHARLLTQCNVLIRRSFVNMYRDAGYYWLRLAMYIAIALAIATIFFHLDSSFAAIQARGSAIMFVASFLTFMAIGGFPSFVEDMKVFQRERLNGHYPCGAFVVGNTLSSVPYLVMISIIPGAIIYYSTGFHKGVGNFCYFTAVLFTCMALVESIMMIVASLVPNFLMGLISGAAIQGLMILGAGFFRLPTDLPKPLWKYPVYYISFHKYAFQGLSKNEFEGLKFSSLFGDGEKDLDGDVILRQFWKVETGYSKWVDLAILSGMMILYRFIFLCILKADEKLKPIIAAFLTTPKWAKETRQVMVNPSNTPSYA